MTYSPSFDDLVSLNADIVGSRARVLNPGHVHSALGRPFHTYGGDLLYPTVIAQAAALLEGLVAAHGFSDGNKRTAWVATKAFLRHNGIPTLSPPPGQTADFVEGIALHIFTGQSVPHWIAHELVGWR